MTNSGTTDEAALADPNFTGDQEILTRIFFDHSSECHAILVCLEDGRFRYEEVNDASLQFYHMTREAVIGRTMDELFGADAAAEIGEQLMICLKTGRAHRYDRALGGTFLEAIATPVPGGSGLARVVVSGRDLTERRRLEEQLRQAQKMEAVGQLTGGIAHDFNNLLTVVIGGLDMIGHQAATLPASTATARIIRAKDMALEGARRAATLTSRLLAFSRQQPLAPKIVDPNILIAGLSDFLHRALGEAVALETVLAAGLWRTEIDANQLENALLNLAVNARDAMPGGGKVTIETRNCYLDNAYIAAIAEPVEEGQYIMIAVADTGDGMDTTTLKRAFDPFFTTKEVGKGTGLGLSQVYGFVRQSAGHIKIYSELGHGTTVKLYLRRGLSEDDQIQPIPAPVQSLGVERIMVVEDDDELRAYSTEVLIELGYQVIEACDGVQALEMLDRGGVDLLFTDVVMPGGMNGRQLADEAARRHPGLRVLFTTGYTRNAIIHHGRLDSGVQMISKPFTFAELGEKIRQVLDSPVSLSENSVPESN